MIIPIKFNDQQYFIPVLEKQRISKLGFRASEYICRPTTSSTNPQSVQVIRLKKG